MRQSGPRRRSRLMTPRARNSDHRRKPALLAVLVLVPVMAGCGPESGGRAQSSPPPPASTRAAISSESLPATPAPSRPSGNLLPGMPPPLDPDDVYAATRPGRLRAAVRKFPERVYVPNSGSNTVDVINASTFRRVGRFTVGRLPHHVTPSWDLRTLWVNNTAEDSLTEIDPATGRPGRTVRVTDPYNVYFTPNGRRAIIVAERLRRLDFREPKTMRLRHSLRVPCQGVNHLDFTTDGRHLLASCEFSGHLLRVDVGRERVVGVLPLRPRRPGAKPQDVKLSPDGRVFYVADMASHGAWIVDAARLRVLGFVPTGKGAHGLYPSRDSRHLYVSNRDEGSVSLISFATRKVIETWRLPGGGSPDMGGVSADGRVLWLAGRHHGEVYAIDTRTGRLRARIPVGRDPHGLAIYPQPGRYSLGHTGVLR